MLPFYWIAYSLSKYIDIPVDFRSFGLYILALFYSYYLALYRQIAVAAKFLFFDFDSVFIILYDRSGLISLFALFADHVFALAVSQHLAVQYIRPFDRRLRLGYDFDYFATQFYRVFRGMSVYIKIYSPVFCISVYQHVVIGIVEQYLYIR